VSGFRGLGELSQGASAKSCSKELPPEVSDARCDAKREINTSSLKSEIISMTNFTTALAGEQ
jgi:hypothetical protein